MAKKKEDSNEEIVVQENEYFVAPMYKNYNSFIINGNVVPIHEDGRVYVSGDNAEVLLKEGYIK